MRINRIKNLETVYILGAGSSFAFTLPKSAKISKKTTPLDKTFNERMLSLTSRKSWVSESIQSIKTNWIGDPKVLKSIGLEESIIQRLGNYELLEAIHKIKLTGNKKSSSKINNAEYVNHLSHLIVETLSKCRESSSSRAQKFVDKVYKGRDNKSKHRIITFNYDCILDNVLLDHIKIPPNQLYFDRIKNSKDQRPNRLSSDVFEHPFLLKLHGSSNWRIAKNIYEQIINGEKLDENRPQIWLDRENIPQPNDDISPLIMPPLPYKPITKTSIFSYLWTCAFEYLHEAKKIIIAGYSCPSTDSFAMSLLSQLNNKNLEEIFIVDPDSSSLNKYQKILNVKKTKKIKWSYSTDFMDFVDQLS